MAVYLKKFENHTQYETYTASTEFITPNVSICTTEGDVHYNPYVEPIETRLVAKFNVTDTTNPTPIGYNEDITGFSAIEIDGVAQPSVVSTYTFSTTGEHVVKYTLTDPTSISEYAFRETSLTSCTIPDGVTSIGGHAFMSATSLVEIEIPNSVTSIGDGTFNDCTSLTRVSIPSGVTSIGDYTFANCNLTNIVIPDSVTSIGDYAFRNNSGLTSCTIGSGVTSIDTYAFYNCGFTSITIPSGITRIDYGTFSSCKNLESIDIPNGVTSIGTSAFASCTGLTSCTIGSGVTSIGNSAFAYCSSLTGIDIPSGVTSISKWAFQNCTSLTSITVNRTTPPTLAKNVFDNTDDCPIYVPSGSVNSYKSASNWSTYASRIQAIS